jgi:FkbM family methyltransferase
MVVRRRQGAEATSTREAVVAIGNGKFRLVSDDGYLDRIEPAFEPDTVRLLQSLARDARLAVDVGANIGCTALLLAGLARRVLAFEPSPTTYGLLLQNVARSGLANIETRNVGLGAESAASTLTHAADNRSGAFVSDRTRASLGHVVETIELRTLDDVVSEQDASMVDFVKIDVEGFEPQVLRGAGRTLAGSRPVVVLELNHWCLNALQRTSVPDFLDLLRGTFPILCAVERRHYLDLHDESERYIVMYQHILHGRFPLVVGAYDEDRLRAFRADYRRGFVAGEGWLSKLSRQLHKVGSRVANRIWGAVR